MTEASKLTAALGGRWHGNYGTAACPVCQSERRKDQSALTLSDGDHRLLLHCKKSGCSFSDVLRAAGVPSKRPQTELPRRAVSRAQGGTATTDHAKKLWQASVAIEASPAEAYLRNERGIGSRLPTTLRYNPRTWHGRSRQNMPAMIALIEGGDTLAVSRTYLRPGGSGKADLLKGEQKMMLGNAKGGHVVLQAGPGPLVVAEGVETALSLPSLFDLGTATLWAALTASNLRGVTLPVEPGHLIVATDGDEAGRTAGQDLAARAVRFGWRAEMMPAPEGWDWNDVLLDRDARREGGGAMGNALMGGRHGV